jgi:hypothetical protein
MLKKILKLEGAESLSKNEQKSISGGNAPSNCASRYLAGYSDDFGDLTCIARIGGQSINGTLVEIGGVIYCCI